MLLCVVHCFAITYCKHSTNYKFSLKSSYTNILEKVGSQIRSNKDTQSLLHSCYPIYYEVESLLLPYLL